MPLPADWLQYVADLSRELKQPPDPIKRRQPRIQRMESAEMRAANRQTRNAVRAIYVPESQYNVTPTRPDDWRGVEHEVGPGQRHGNVATREVVVDIIVHDDADNTIITETVQVEVIDSRSVGAKVTKSRTAGERDGMSRVQPRKGGRGRRQARPSTDLDAMIQEYLS